MSGAYGSKYCSWCCQINSCKWGKDTSSQHEWRITWITAFGFMINIVATEKKGIYSKRIFQWWLVLHEMGLGSRGPWVCNKLSLGVEVMYSKKARQKFVCVNVKIIFAIVVVCGKFFCQVKRTDILAIFTFLFIGTGQCLVCLRDLSCLFVAKKFVILTPNWMTQLCSGRCSSCNPRLVHMDRFLLFLLVDISTYIHEFWGESLCKCITSA